MAEGLLYHQGVNIQTDNLVAKEEVMGNVISHVPELLKKKGWGPMDLVRKTTMSLDTAYRLARGEASISKATIEQLCKLFGVPVQKVIEYVPDEGEQPGA